MVSFSNKPAVPVVVFSLPMVDFRSPMVAFKVFSVCCKSKLERLVAVLSRLPTILVILPLFLSRLAVNELRLLSVPASAPVCVFSKICNDADAPIRLAVVLFRFSSVAAILFFALGSSIWLILIIIESIEVTALVTW